MTGQPPGANPSVPSEADRAGEPGEVRVRPLGTDAAIIEVRGVVDLFTAQELEQVAAEQVARDRIRLLVDLAGVPLCDSTGLTVLIRIHRLTDARGGWLRLVAPRPQVRGLLEMTNLTRIFDVYDSMAEALPAE
jgi:anti-sigma B factor antagonist